MPVWASFQEDHLSLATNFFVTFFSINLIMTHFHIIIFWYDDYLIGCWMHRHFAIHRRWISISAAHISNFPSQKNSTGRVNKKIKPAGFAASASGILSYLPSSCGSNPAAKSPPMDHLPIGIKLAELSWIHFNPTTIPMRISAPSIAAIVNRR